MPAIIIIPHVNVVRRDWPTEVYHSMPALPCSGDDVTLLAAVHILRLLMKSSLPLLVTPSGESVSHQSPVTLTSSKTADSLSPRHQRRSVVGYGQRALSSLFCICICIADNAP